MFTVPLFFGYYSKILIIIFVILTVIVSLITAIVSIQYGGKMIEKEEMNLEQLIHLAITKRIEIIVQKEVIRAKANIESQINSMIDSVALEILKHYTIIEDMHNIRIEVRKMEGK